MKKTARIIASVLIVVLFMLGLSKMVMPKFYYYQEWPTTTTYRDFYDMEKDTIDVLFLGSSRGQSSYDPQCLYDNYGITSFNLCSETQSVVMGYWWLVEALNYQTPKAVVMESQMLWALDEVDNYVLNSNKASVFKALDGMKFGKVKRNCIDDLTNIDDSIGKKELYSSFFRYHSRWGDFSEDDFRMLELNQVKGLHGYTALAEKYEVEGYKPYEQLMTYDVGVNTGLHSVATVYFEKMVSLCEDNGIELILTTTPSFASNPAANYILTDYCKKLGINYFDFNEATQYSAINYDYKNDNKDGTHVNYYGAQKITKFIGQQMKEQLYLLGAKDYTFENSKKQYNEVVYNVKLKSIKDFNKYLKAINLKRYSVFVIAEDDPSQFMSEEYKKAFEEFLATDIDVNDYKDTSLVIVKDGDKVQQEVSKDTQAGLIGSLNDGLIRYELSSVGSGADGGTCCMNINGQEYGFDYDGLCFVVYDNHQHKVVDSVCFVGNEEKAIAVREKRT